MAMTVKCPGCSVTHKVLEELLGKTVKCSSCNATMRLPAPPKVVTARALPKREAIAEFEVVEDEPEAPIRFKEEDDEPIRPKKRPKRRKKKKTSIIATILVSIWFFVIVPGGIIARHLSIREKINRINNHGKEKDDPRKSSVWRNVSSTNFGCHFTIPVSPTMPFEVPSTVWLANLNLTGSDDQRWGYLFDFDIQTPNPRVKPPKEEDSATKYIDQMSRVSLYSLTKKLAVQGRPAFESELHHQQSGKTHLSRIIAENHPSLGLIIYKLTVVAESATLDSPNVRRYFDSIKFDRTMQ